MLSASFAERNLDGSAPGAGASCKPVCGLAMNTKSKRPTALIRANNEEKTPKQPAQIPIHTVFMTDDSAGRVSGSAIRLPRLV